VTRWPTLGTLDIAEDGSFTYVGTSDYFEFSLYADGVASAVDIGYGAGIVRVTLGVGSSGFGAGATLGIVVASGTLSGAAASAFGAGALLAGVVGSGALTGLIVSQFGGGATLAPAVAAGLLYVPGAYASQPTTTASWSYRQTATLWRLTGRDAWTGQVTHAAPVLFLCDYAEDEQRLRLSSGEEFTTQLLIYTSLPGVKQGDMVLIGSSSSADPFAAGASEVRAVRTWADTFTADGPPDFRIAT
jgi:hypothetical protein